MPVVTEDDFKAAVVPLDREGETLIDARQLHAWLGVGDKFNMWMRRRIEEYGFEADTDFCASLRKTGGRPAQDYLLTVDTAKELSMVERTERGKQTRRYFIDMEKAARRMAAERAVQQLPASWTAEPDIPSRHLAIERATAG